MKKKGITFSFLFMPYFNDISVYICGENTQWAVLCTESHSYRLIEENTSNSHLFVNSNLLQDQENLKQVVVHGSTMGYLQVKHHCHYQIV